MLTTASALAQNSEKNVLVYYGGGQLDVFPESLVKAAQTVNDQFHVTTLADTAFCYDNDKIDSVVTRTYRELLGRLPKIMQFKVNNKYNDQVYVDVIADIKEDSVITASIPAIGRWLRPSIQLSDENALLYIGNERQQDKVSRRSFANDVYYTLAKPQQRVYQSVLVKEAVWSEATEKYQYQSVLLTPDMFSSNLPGKKGESFEQMLDDNVNTFFHSTWDVPQEEKQAIYETHPYIDIALDEALETIRFSYTTRNDDEYALLGFTLLASNDGTSWKKVKAFTDEADNLPLEKGSEYVSGEIALGGKYKYLRFYLDASQHRLYLTLAEFRLWSCVENPDAHEAEELEPAVYEYHMLPFGRKYRVHIDWLVDHSKEVPRVDINIENGYMVTSKAYYLNADITIDGKGVFPSMETTPVQIKGRGNSSWDDGSPWAKNPYRLKFEEKQKPFGLTKGKNWVLLANKQYGSMMTNAIGMKAACLVGTAGANHMVPVDLYINGQYRGSYNFTEKVGLANNSIDLEDESRATLLELDTYYDEQYRFRSNPYHLPVNIKEPDFSEGKTLLTQESIEKDFTSFMYAIKNGNDLSTYCDMEMLARYLMLNDLIANFEIMHPKSTFLYNESVGTQKSKFVFGPVWDLDWAFGYETSGGNRQYYSYSTQSDFWRTVNMEAVSFINDLRFNYKDLDRLYYIVWSKFKQNGLQELLDFCDDYFAYARPSFENNAYYWGDGNNYESLTAKAKRWLQKRFDYVYRTLEYYNYDNPERPIIDDFDYDGDVNGIEIVKPDNDMPALVDVYDLNGRCVKRRASALDLRSGLQPGIYIVGGKKMIIM